MTTATDPVCGMDVEVEGARYTWEYEGTTYCFCAKGCMLDFQEDPRTYLDPSYRHEGM